MISTRSLLGRGTKPVTIEPAEPLTVEGEELSQDVATYLRRANEEQRALISESDELGRQMADLLAAKELGQPVDPESLITIAERRQTVRQQLEAVEFRIRGLMAQQDALQATENERRRAALLPLIEQSGELSTALFDQFMLRMGELSETVEAMIACGANFDDLTLQWGRVSQNVGHGVASPPQPWKTFLAPDVVRQLKMRGELHSTLAQQVERVLVTEPQRRREQFLRDHEKDAAEQARRKREEHNHYLNYLQQRRIAATNGYTDFPDYQFVIPGELKHLQSDLDYTGER